MLTTTTVNVAGKICNMVVYVPDGATSLLPAVVFIPGIGEQNTDVNGLYTHGPLNFIKSGWKPDFVVAGIQPSQGWPGVDWTDAMLKALVTGPYKVDQKKICLTGLSAGASVIFDYINSLPANSSYIVPASIIGFSFSLYNYPAVPWQNLPAWGLCGDKDDNQTGYGFFGPQSDAWKQMQAKGWPNKPWTTMVGYGHGNWNDFYKPDYVDAGTKKSLYDWMKQFVTGASPVVAPVVNSVWGKVEAESYSAMSGVNTANNASDDATKFVGWIDKGDWMDFNVDVPADGTYNVDLRVAAFSGGATAQLLNGTTVLANVNIPNTGSFDVYKTITVQVPFRAGKQTIRLLSTSLTNWNINWLMFGSVVTTAPAPVPAPTPAAKTLAATYVSTLKVYSDGSFENNIVKS